MGSLVAALVLTALYVRSRRRDPRRLRLGVYLVLVGWIVLGGLLQAAQRVLPRDDLWSLLPFVPIPLTVLGLAGFLVANGLTMVRKEGRSLGNLLSLLMGLALVAAPFVGYLLAATKVGALVGLAAFTFFVCVWLGANFAAFLAYALSYRRTRPRDDPAAVVVLGSGLLRGEAPPLLRGRLDRAVEVWRHQLDLGHVPLLVPSGGQGADEPRPEGVVMGEYLTSHGVPSDTVVVEERARTTEENLVLSATLTGERGRDGSFTIVTSDYHVARAALISRRLGLDADVVGADTARYFVPSAFLREFVAVMSYHPLLHAAFAVPALAVSVLLARAV